MARTAELTYTPVAYPPLHSVVREEFLLVINFMDHPNAKAAVTTV